jgi:hypothetical protein
MHEYSVAADDDACRRYVGDLMMAELLSVGPAPPRYKFQTTLVRQAAA